MKKSELDAIIRGIAPVVRKYIDEQVARIEGRLDETRKRIQELERKVQANETE